MGLHKSGQRGLSASGWSVGRWEGPSWPTLLLLTKALPIAMLQTCGDLPRDASPSFLESAIPSIPTHEPRSSRRKENSTNTKLGLRRHEPARVAGVWTVRTQRDRHWLGAFEPVKENGSAALPWYRLVRRRLARAGVIPLDRLAYYPGRSGRRHGRGHNPRKECCV